MNKIGATIKRVKSLLIFGIGIICLVFVCSEPVKAVYPATAGATQINADVRKISPLNPLAQISSGKIGEGIEQNVQSIFKGLKDLPEAAPPVFIEESKKGKERAESETKLTDLIEPIKSVIGAAQNAVSVAADKVITAGKEAAGVVADFLNFNIGTSEVQSIDDNFGTSDVQKLELSDKEIAEEFLKKSKSVLAPFTQDFLLPRERLVFERPPSAPLISPEFKQDVKDIVNKIVQKISDIDIAKFFAPKEAEEIKEQLTQLQAAPVIDEKTLNNLIERISARLPEVQQVIKETKTEREIQTKETQVIISEQKINELASLLNQLKQKQATDRQDLFNAMALSNRINTISGASLSNVTITSPTFSSGAITDDDIPDTITASNYLPLSGGTVTGNLTVSGTTNFGAAVNDTLGVGTSSPSKLFAVHGESLLAGTTTVADLIATGTLDIKGTGTSTVQNNMRVMGTLQVGSGTTYISSGEISATETFTIRTQSSDDHLVLQSLGRVGVSSTTPWGVLSVERNGANANMPIFVVSEQGTSSPYLIVKDTGLVGIGTTSPSQLLAVHGSALISGNLSVANLTATGTLTLSGQTTLTNASTSQLTVSDSAWLATGGGSVGLGTTSPSSLLSVHGSALISNNLTAANIIATGTLALKGISGTSTIAAGQGFVVGSGQEPPHLLVQQSSGRAGISTSSPSQLFSVHGQSLLAGTTTVADLIATGTLDIKGAGTSTIQNNLRVLGTLQVGSGTTYLSETALTSSQTFTISTQSDANHLVLQTLGRVGISSSTPWGVLSVEHNSADASMPVFVVSDEGTSSPSMLIDWSGKVGLGTTSPSQLLSVQGDALISGTTTAGVLYATSSIKVGTTSPIVGLGSGLQVSNLGYLEFSGVSTFLGLGDTQTSFTANRIIHTNAGGTALTDTAGFVFDGTNLGIGTTSPSQLLSVHGQSLLAGTTTVADLVATGTITSKGTATSTFSGGISANSLSSSNGLVLSGGNLLHSAANFVVQSGGSVGIGTTSPSQLLSVQGNALFSGNLTFARLTATGTSVFQSNLGIGSSTPYARLAIRANVGDATRLFSVASSSDDTYFEISSTGTTTIEQLQTGALTFDTNAGAVTWMDMPVTGGAAVGTVMRYSAMIDASSTLTVYSESDGAGGIKNQRVGIATSSPWATLAVELQNATDPSFVISGQGTPRLIMDSSGKLGINAANPYSRLQVTGGGTGAGQLFALVNSASTTLMQVLDNGNVGIGTTSPSQLLSVQGDALISGTTTVGGLLSTSSMFSILPNGNVGIGKANPAARLDVAGSYPIQARFPDGSVLATQGPGIAFTSVSDSGFGVNGSNLAFWESGTIALNLATNLREFRIPSDFTYAWSAATNNNASSDTSFYRNAAGVLRTGGSFIADSNVGISTTSPSQLLSVQGDALISGTTTAGVLYATSSIKVGTTSPIVGLGSNLSVNSSGYLQATAGASTFLSLTDTQSSFTANRIIHTNAGGTALTDTAGFVFDGTNLGIGTTSPSQLLSVQGNALFSGNLTSVANITATGSIGIGSSTPYARLAIRANVGDATRLFSVASSSDDTYFEISSTGTTTIEQLQTGALTFDQNAGLVSWIDMPVTGGAASGTLMGYSAMIDASSTLVVYGKVDSSGNIRKQAVAVPGGALCVDNDGTLCPDEPLEGRIYANNATVLTDDIAELMRSSEALEPGDIVAPDPDFINGTSAGYEQKRRSSGLGTEKNLEDLGVKKSTESYQAAIMGVVSTKPGITLGGFEPTSKDHEIALAGRAPVKVNLENGPIAIGDPITSSSVPGVGMKATKSGKIIGYALESLLTNDPRLTTNEQPKILALISIGYWIGPDLLEFSASASTTPSTEGGGLLASIINAVKSWLESLQVFIEDGLVRLKNLVAEKITTDALEIRDKATGEIHCVSIINGQIQAVLGGCDSNGGPSDVQNIDTEPPVITLNGPSAIEIEIGTAWADPGATVTDPSTGSGQANTNLGIYHKVNGVLTPNEGREPAQLDTSTSTVYAITYFSTDSAGNTGTAERTVTVK